MIQKINKNFKEEFILHYKAALKSKLSREQFSKILNIKPESITRRRLAIFKETGLDLPLLESKIGSELTQDAIEKFNIQLKDLSREKNDIPSTIDFDHKKKIFVITSAQNATPVHEGFLSSLLNYCENRNAQLVVIPNRYKNPTSVWTQNNEGDEWWDNKLIKYICSEDLRLTKSLRIMGHIKIQPTAERPLSGFDSYTGQDSAVFGHPKIQLKTVATPSKILPKLLTTTGSVTISNYTDSKAGWKSHKFHALGAVIVELEEDGTFHLRHIQADDITGHFYDLNKYYSSTEVKNNFRISALITGDTHAEFIDENVLNATYLAKNSIVEVLMPEYIIFHDLEDFYRRSHHSINNNLLSYGKHHGSRNNVEKGLQKTADFLDKVTRPDIKNIIIKSNHDEAFDKWLLNSNPNIDPENSRFFHYMKYHQYKNMVETDVGYSTIDPFEFWCRNPDQEKGLKNIENTIFLKRDQSFVINDIELGFHGDIGLNGTKGNINQYRHIGPSAIIGHSHTPGRIEGVIQVGTSSKLKLEYNTGCSSWLHSHAIIYPDGRITLINIINGKWTL